MKKEDLARGQVGEGVITWIHTFVKIYWTILWNGLILLFAHFTVLLHLNRTDFKIGHGIPFLLFLIEIKAIPGLIQSQGTEFSLSIQSFCHLANNRKLRALPKERSCNGAAISSEWDKGGKNSRSGDKHFICKGPLKEHKERVLTTKTSRRNTCGSA